MPIHARLLSSSPFIFALLIACKVDGGDEVFTPTGTAGVTAEAGSSTGESDSETGEGDADSAADAGDGDGDGASMGDGDDSSTGDGDGDGASTGDGDGDGAGDGDGDESSTGDGDGDGDGDDSSTGDGDSSDTGDGDGDSSSTGDGDGDTTTTGDGDGDTSTTGDGDGDGSTTGDGDGDGDGDVCDGVSTCTVLGEQQCFGNTVQTCVEDQMTCLVWEDSQDCTNLGAFICTENGSSANCEEESPCFTEQPVVDFKPATIMFVLDYSGSMCQKIGSGGGGNCNPNGDTRWKALRTVVDSVATQYEGTIKFGANLFPHALDVSDPDFGACAVESEPEVLPVLNNASGLDLGLPADNSIDPYGFTPAESGYRSASDWMDTGNNLPPLSEENRAIIFILDGAISDGRSICVTQGQTTVCGDDGSGAYYDQFYSRECSPSCTNLPSQNACDMHWQEAPTSNDVDTLTNEIASNEQSGVPTFVVGIDIDSEYTDEMNGYANAGGYPLGGAVQYYETASQDALNAALAGIVDVLSSCTIDLNVVAPDPTTTQIDVNGTTYFQITAAECMQGDPGWYYSTPDYLTIELCGAACDEFQSTGQADVEYFCDAN